MKKIWILIIFIVSSITLSSCMQPLTYDDLFLMYQNDVNDKKDLYETYIDLFKDINEISYKAVVKVEKSSGFSSAKSIGTGFIFHEDPDAYYVITNHHVIYSESGIYELNIIDYKKNDYEGTLMISDDHYDLAVIKIDKGEEVLSTLAITQEEMTVEEHLIVVGYPSGQINAVTIGAFVDYTEVDLTGMTDVIDIDFPVYIMDVPVEAGSSGSVVLNEELQVIGIIYAGNFIDDSNQSEFAFAVPNAKIIEFFDVYDISYIKEETS